MEKGRRSPASCPVVEKWGGWEKMISDIIICMAMIEYMYIKCEAEIGS